MSIIYDALQKAQQNREYLRLQTQTAVIPKKSHWRYFKPVGLVVLVLAVSAGAGAVASFYLRPLVSAGKLLPASARNAAVPTPSKNLESTHLWVSENSPKTALTKEVKLESSQELKPATEVKVATAEQNTVLAIQSPLPPPAPAVPPTVTPAYLNKLTLNGVLISELDKTALINNQAFHVGDMVDGMRIVSIEFNRVRLQSGQDLLELRVPV